MSPIHYAKIKCRRTGEKQYIFEKKIEIYSCRLEDGKLKEDDRRPKINPPYNKPKFLFSYQKD